MSAGDEPNIVVFTDTFFETNGVGSYYRTLLDWSRRNSRGKVVVVCPFREDRSSHRGDMPASREDTSSSSPERCGGEGSQNASGGVYHITDDVIAVRPAFRFRNPFYRDLLLGHYGQSKLRRIVRSIRGPKVIHTATSGPLGVAGSKVAKALGLASVGCYHTDLQKYAALYAGRSLGPLGPWACVKVARFCDRRAYSSCVALCVPSESAAETVKPFFKGEVTVIPNPIDVSRFRPASSREGAFRRKYNPDGKVLAVVVGRVAKEKNLDLICRLLSKDERIKTVFVGDGPHSEALTRRWNATVTGFLQGEELLAAYQQADVFVQLSVTETFGLSLVEALASGLPAVVLRAPGFIDSIPPGQGIDIFEEDELSGFADHCVALVSDSDRHRENARKACAFVQQLGADAILPKFFELHRRFAR